MDTKPELIRLEPVDPAVISGNNMYIKNEVLYHVDTPSHHIVKKEEPKLYYDSGHHHHLQETTKHYIPDTVHNFQTVKPMSQYPKYQTPKLRAKSTYSPMKTMIPQTTPPTHHHNMYMKHDTDIGMIAEQQQQQMNHAAHQTAGAGHDHNTVQVITPNTNYGTQQQWNSNSTQDVTMTPIMEQSIHGGTAAGDVVSAGGSTGGGGGGGGAAGSGTPADAIFIPESAVGMNTSDNSSDYNPGAMAPTINLIPLMTPNGLMFVAANSSSSGAVLGGVPSNNTVDTHHIPSATSAAQQQQQQPQSVPQHNVPPQTASNTSSRSYNRRKQPAAKRVPHHIPQQQQQPQPSQQQQPHVEIVSQELATNTQTSAVAPNTSNLIYTQNGPLLLLNENRAAQQHHPHQHHQLQQQQHHHHQQQQVDYKPVINTPVAPLIPEKGTVIEEPPKAIYQSRYSDINENSTRYNSKNGVKSGSSNVQTDAELDLDAAITVFKIYK